MNFAQGVPPRLSPDWISGPDIAALVHLLGETIAFLSEDPARRNFLMDNFCELIGADGWTAVEHGNDIVSGRDGHLISSNSSGHDRIARRLLIFRHQDKEPFTLRERRLAGILLEESGWLYETEAAPESGSTASLSVRETQVLRRLRLGLDRKAIANCLNLSPNTVADHLRSIYRKFGVGGHLELMRVTAILSPEEQRAP